jgi:AbrB family looped-hinge helix DNA binding protein
MTIRLRPKNQVTIPTKLTDELGWSQGETLRVTRDQDRIVIEPEPLGRIPATTPLEDALTDFEPLELAKGWTVADILAADRSETA